MSNEVFLIKAKRLRELLSQEIYLKQILKNAVEGSIWIDLKDISSPCSVTINEAIEQEENDEDIKLLKDQQDFELKPLYTFVNYNGDEMVNHQNKNIRLQPFSEIPVNINFLT